MKEFKNVSGIYDYISYCKNCDKPSCELDFSFMVEGDYIFIGCTGYEIINDHLLINLSMKYTLSPLLLLDVNLKLNTYVISSDNGKHIMSEKFFVWMQSNCKNCNASISTDDFLFSENKISNIGLDRESVTIGKKYHIVSDYAMDRMTIYLIYIGTMSKSTQYRIVATVPIDGCNFDYSDKKKLLQQLDTLALLS